MQLRSLVLVLAVALIALGARHAHGQNYPAKLIRMATAASGSNNDWAARIIAQELTRSLGQQVIVENRGALAIDYAVKSPPDGYTLLFYGNAVWLTPLLRDKVAYDPIRDLAPVTLAIMSPLVIVVHPSMPIRSVKDLIALARARPGQLNYAAGTIGASPHLATELFKAMTHTDIVRVPYKGAGPSVTALVGGEVHLMFAGLGSVAAQIKSNRLRAIAVATAKPSALIPDLPTIAATVPGFEAISIIGMFAPAGTPVAIVNLLQREIARGIRKPDVRNLMFNAGVEVVAGTPEEFAVTIKSEMARLGKVIRDAGIHE